MTSAKTNFTIKIVLGLVFIAFNVAVFIPIYRTLTTGSTDLYPSWIGAKLFFEEGMSPYDDRVGLASQNEIYGRPTLPGEDKMLYVYPFYGVFFIGPLILISYQLAAALYMQFMLLSLITALILCLDILQWLPSPVMLATLLLFTILGYFSVRGLLLAQFAIIGYLGHVIALWGIYKGHDTVAGMGLVISTIKPQTGYLIVPLLLLWAWRFQRWNLIVSFVIGFGLLMGFSFALQPSWMGAWLDQIQAYLSYTETLSAGRILTQEFFPKAWEDVSYGLLVILLAIPVIGFWKQALVDKTTSSFFWGYNLTLVFSLSIATRTATTYYIELYPVLYGVAWLVSQRGQALKYYALGVVLVIGYWALHILTVPDVATNGAGKEAPIVYLVFPVIIWGLLFLYRREALPAPPERGLSHG